MEELNDFEYEEREEQEQPRKKKKGKVWIVIVAAVLVLALLALGAFLLLPKLTGGKSASNEWEEINAYITDDGSAAYFILPGGESIKVKGDDIVTARITKDFQHIAVRLKDGTLYVTDRNLKNKWEISDDSDGFALYNNCLFFGENDDDNRVSRADFKSREIVDLPKEAYVCGIGDTNGKGSIAFEKNNSLYVLPDGEEDPVKIGSDVKRFGGLSGDGRMVIWAGSKDEKITLYVSEGEEKISLGQLGSTDIYAMFTKDGRMVVIISWDDGKLWVKERGKDAVSVKYSGSPSSITTDAGYIGNVNASQVKYIFLSVRDDGGRSLYRISLKDGEKEKVLSKTNDVRYMGGAVAYTKDGDLFVAKMGKNELGEAEKIAGDVQSFRLYGEDPYLYYMRDDVLYGYKIGSKEPEKIASDVDGYSVSKNGKVVVFMKDEESDNGTLYLWKFGGKGPEKIASDASTVVLEDSGGVYYSRIDGDTFDMMYYDGRESRKIASGLKK